MLRFLWIHSTNVKGLALVSQNRLRLFIILGIESSKPRRKNVEPAPHNFCWLPPFLLGFFFFFCSFLWVIVGSNWQEFVGNYSTLLLPCTLTYYLPRQWITIEFAKTLSQKIPIKFLSDLGRIYILLLHSFLIKFNV